MKYLSTNSIRLISYTTYINTVLWPRGISTDTIFLYIRIVGKIKCNTHPFVELLV
jgi:hypothetical protein